MSAAWCLGAVLAMAAAAATAASAAEPEAEAEVGLDEGPHYRVEMIVFRYGEGVAAGNEIFPPEDEGTHEPLERSPEEAQDDAMDSPLPDLDRRREAVWSDRPADAADMPRNLRRPGTEAAIVGEENGEANGDEARDGALSGGRSWIRLELADAQGERMSAIHERLEAIDAYQPLLRATWVQTTHGADRAPAIPLRALGLPPPGLDGTVKLYAGRFLHLVVDLALAAEHPASSPMFDGSHPPARERVRYRIREDRIMRNGDVRYFDHPKFGIVARVSEVEKAEEAETAESHPGREAQTR